MSYLNLMGNKLKPKEVNDALMNMSENSTPAPTPTGRELQHASLTKTGDGTQSYSIMFPVEPKMVQVRGVALGDEWCGTSLFTYGVDWVTFITDASAVLGGSITYSQDKKTMTLTTTSDAGYIGNKSGCTIKVDYFY